MATRRRHHDDMAMKSRFHCRRIAYTSPPHCRHMAATAPPLCRHVAATSPVHCCHVAGRLLPNRHQSLFSAFKFHRELNKVSWQLWQPVSWQRGGKVTAMRPRCGGDVVAVCPHFAAARGTFAMSSPSCWHVGVMSVIMSVRCRRHFIAMSA